ncbi:hypothetical protein ANCCAN_26111 [Ancylostoma caninum]|uniref:Uncharacterized protein n=1 Tax=Ancylostoma caninum TaxID=29170 RepID=A0A368F7L6_ANCCA|nr:hypothetical protein ANCCAN_26111 [Ancylostoma caninum]
MKIVIKVIILCDANPSLHIARNDDNGGDISVKNYEELEHEFLHGSKPDFPLHPGDLKNAVVSFING